MSGDLVKRLREISTCMKRDYRGEFDNWADWIARSAEHLQALEAENAKLRAERDGERAKHRETLEVLQTAHEGEEAAQATIRRLMNDLQAHKDALAQANVCDWFEARCDVHHRVPKS